MCRTGGRRCPGQDTPEGRAARNARRRAQYAARKGKGGSTTGTPAESHIGPATGEEPRITPKEYFDSLPKTVDTTSTAPLSETEQKGADTLHEKVAAQEKQSTSEKGDNVDDVDPHKLSVHSRESYGLKKKVGLNELPAVMTGTIDYDKLDDESYQYFGLKAGISSKYRPDNDIVRKESEAELKKVSLTPEELGAVKGYTEADFGVMNKCLFNPEAFKEYKKGPSDPEKIQSQLRSAGNSSWQSAIVDERDGKEEITQNHLRGAVAALDAAIARGPKVQRRLYRGIGVSEIGIESDSWGHDEEIVKKVDAWVDENRSVGTVIQFNGFQSSSLSPATASGFATSINGSLPIVYEIVTPEGIAVESVTRNPMENEVILPRQSKYVVVGVHKDINLNAESHQTFTSNRATLIQLVAVNSNNEILDGTNSDPLTDPFAENKGKTKTKTKKNNTDSKKKAGE